MTSDATAAAPPPAPAPAPDPALVLFARGVIARLELWPALRVAVEQGWGGPSSREKRRWLASEIVDAFDAFDTRTRTRSAPASSAAAAGPRSSSSSSVLVPVPDAEYVAMMLAQVLEDEFDASFEDGSVEAVAGDIVALWGASEEVMREWERKAEGARGKKVAVREEVGDEDEDEWEDEESEDGDGDEAPQLTPAAPQVQRPAKPKLLVDENGFTLVGKGRR
ncbi:Pre-rRNA-processing protein TSR2-domain-containing protein [Russula dissimulans]|nr:Pre-rRNA-processing protein TSR2-domain-containing protein [Russula dissimulans]